MYRRCREHGIKVVLVGDQDRAERSVAVPPHLEQGKRPEPGMGLDGEPLLLVQPTGLVQDVDRDPRLALGGHLSSRLAVHE